MKEFHVNTEVYFGERALDRLAQLHYDRVFIVSDPFVVSSGMIKLVTDPLTRAGIAFDVFTAVIITACKHFCSELQRYFCVDPFILCYGFKIAVDAYIQSRQRIRSCIHARSRKLRHGNFCTFFHSVCKFHRAIRKFFHFGCLRIIPKKI